MFDFCDRNWAFIFRADMLSVVVSDGKIIKEMGARSWWEILMLITSISKQRDENKDLSIKKINWSPQLYADWGEGNVFLESEMDERGQLSSIYHKGKVKYVFMRMNSLECKCPYRLVVGEVGNPENCFVEIDMQTMGDLFRIFVAFLEGNFINNVK